MAWILQQAEDLVNKLDQSATNAINDTASPKSLNLVTSDNNNNLNSNDDNQSNGGNSANQLRSSKSFNQFDTKVGDDEKEKCQSLQLYKKSSNDVLSLVKIKMDNEFDRNDHQNFHEEEIADENVPLTFSTNSEMTGDKSDDLINRFSETNSRKESETSSSIEVTDVINSKFSSENEIENFLKTESEKIHSVKTIFEKPMQQVEKVVVEKKDIHYEQQQEHQGHSSQTLSKSKPEEIDQSTEKDVNSLRQMIEMQRRLLKDYEETKRQQFERLTKLEKEIVEEKELRGGFETAKKGISLQLMEEMKKNEELTEDLKNAKNENRVIIKSFNQYKQKVQRMLNNNSMARKQSGSTDLTNEFNSNDSDDVIYQLRLELDRRDNEINMLRLKNEQIFSTFSEQNDKDKRDIREKDILINKLKNEMKEQLFSLTEQKEQIVFEQRKDEDEMKKIERNILNRSNNQMEKEKEETFATINQHLQNRLDGLSSTVVQQNERVEMVLSEKKLLEEQLKQMNLKHQELQMSLSEERRINDMRRRQYNDGIITFDDDDLDNRNVNNNILPKNKYLTDINTQYTSLYNANQYSCANQLLRERVRDPNWLNQIRRFIRMIDTLVFRGISSLRHFTTARLCLIGYFILLHIWVFFVLATYTPEIHSASHDLPNSDHGNN
ncbi:hypothetical protein SNEBB_003653 [Seison nebaliae]|nr:hypothetical protein SNEBB_003653 [Seison nebaliae]